MFYIVPAENKEIQYGYDRQEIEREARRCKTVDENCSIYREIVSSQIEQSKDLLYDDEESSNFTIDADYIKKTTGGK